VQPLDFLSVMAQRLIFSYLRDFIAFGKDWQHGTNSSPSRDSTQRVYLKKKLCEIIAHTPQSNPRAYESALRAKKCLKNPEFQSKQQLIKQTPGLYQFEECLLQEFLSLKSLLHL
jgi:hypothetical protein